MHEFDVKTDLGPEARSQVSFYDIAKNTQGLIDHVSKQAIQRSANLPEGMQQQIYIDILGQAVTPEQEDSIIKAIFSKTHKLINPKQVIFKR